MNLFRRLLAVSALLAVCVSCTAVRVIAHSTSNEPIDFPSGRYPLDPHHWSVSFDVDHLGYSRFAMRFDRVTAQLDFQADAPERSRVTAVIDAASLDTNVAELDKLVTGPDLLDAEHYSEIRFTSTNLHLTGKNSGEMTGDLTLHGTTRPITLDVTFNGGAPNPLTREETLGFTATGRVDRASFGLSHWYPAVGNEIRVTIQAEFANAP